MATQADLQAICGATVAGIKAYPYTAAILFTDGRELHFAVTLPGPDGEQSLLVAHCVPAEDPAAARTGRSDA